MANVVFSGARAKTLEKNLLSKERITRMVESNSVNEALKVLTEVNFGGGVQLNSPLEFEKLLEHETENLYKFIKESAPDKETERFFTLKNDYDNAEAFIKAKHLKISVESMLVQNGNIAIDKLKDYIFTDEYKSLPDNLEIALNKADFLFVNKTATGQIISSIFKTAYYKDLEAICKSNKYLEKIFQKKADTINISVALRSRDFGVAKTMFISGGTLKEEDLKKLCEAPFETIKEEYKYSKLKELIESAVDATMLNEPITEFEKLADDNLINELKNNRFTADGYLSFLLYCFYKQYEIKNVRIILVCLINNVKKEEIYKRLREQYEG